MISITTIKNINNHNQKPTHLYKAKDGLLRPCIVVKQKRNSVYVKFIRCGKEKKISPNKIIPYESQLLDKPY